jgi:hypothetical protein
MKDNVTLEPEKSKRKETVRDRLTANQHRQESRNLQIAEGFT